MNISEKYKYLAEPLGEELKRNGVQMHSDEFLSFTILLDCIMKTFDNEFERNRALSTRVKQWCLIHRLTAPPLTFNQVTRLLNQLNR